MLARSSLLIWAFLNIQIEFWHCIRLIEFWAKPIKIRPETVIQNVIAYHIRRLGICLGVNGLDRHPFDWPVLVVAKAMIVTRK